MFERWVRPRWGIGSVRLHLDLEDLALALVLFDRVVLPSPDSETEVERWQTNGWEPEAQAVKGVALHPLVHFVVWDEDLRQRWARSMQRLLPIAADVEGLGYMQTTRVIAQSAWVAVEHDRRSEVDKPVPFAWCPRKEEALATLGLDIDSEDGGAAPPVDVFEPDFGDCPRNVLGPSGVDEGSDDPGGGREPALLFSRNVTMPRTSPTDGPEEVLETAVALASDPEFVTARRRMYACVAALTAQGVPDDRIVDELVDAEGVYDTKVNEYGDAGLRRRIHQVVPVGFAVAPALVGLPGIPGSQWGVKTALARFDPLPPLPCGGDTSGEALALVRRVLPRVHSDASRESLARSVVRVATVKRPLE